MRSCLRFAFGMLIAANLYAQVPSPHAIDIPRWFVETFLDFREDVREAAKQDKRLLIYFGQDGCPYCKLLMQTTFTETRIVDLTRKRFVPIALNLWGDREVTWIDGRKMTEKQLGALLSVQFTPTLLFFDEKGRVVLRLNGYQAPQRMGAALEYAAGRMESKQSFDVFVQGLAPEAASATLHAEPYFLKPPYALQRRAGDRPLLVLFERTHCASCDELHREALRRPEVAALISKFDVAQFDPKDSGTLVTPAGQRTSIASWAHQLRIVYAPTLVFFDARGAEVFRAEAYLRPFHLAAVLDYVASGAYRTEPSFQRFVQARADAERARGREVDLWK